MIEFLRRLNLPCRDISRLISAAQDQRLSRGERFAVRLHLLYCSACRKFKRQIRYMRETLQALQDADPVTEAGPGLSPEARERIKRSLRQN